MGWKPPFRWGGEFKGRIEILSTHNPCCRKFVTVGVLSEVCSVCWKFAATSPVYFFFNPQCYWSQPMPDCMPSWQQSYCLLVCVYLVNFCFPIDSILKLMPVWRITGKIIRTNIIVITYACTWSSYNFRFSSHFVFCVSVKVKPFVSLLCVCILPGKAVLEMTYTVSGGTLNPTHSLTHSSSA